MSDTRNQTTPTYIAPAGLDNGWWLGEVRTGDEVTELWLVDPVDTTSRPYPTDVPQHERTGPLPRKYRNRLKHRCGEPRKDGQPCRSTVPGPGWVCSRHRKDAQ